MSAAPDDTRRRNEAPMTQTPSRTRAALPMLALAGLLTACAAVTPARPELPADLVAAESVDLRGLGAGTRGTTAVLGRSLSFQRGASRLSLFDELARSDRSTLQFRWGDGARSALRAECRSVRRTHGAGVVEIVGRPLEIECRFEPDGSWLSMRETRASTLTG